MDPGYVPPVRITNNTGTLVRKCMWEYDYIKNAESGYS